MSSSSSATDCDSLSSPALRTHTSSRPKRGLHSKLGSDCSSNGNGSSSDEVEQDDKRRRLSRFVWTADLHRRFEDAVQRLGLTSAKPEAIRHFMSVESKSDVPSRKTIKSHLQQYRTANCGREAVEQSAEMQLVMQEDFLETNGEPSLSLPSLEAPAATNGLPPSVFFQDGTDKNDLAQIAGWPEADVADIDNDVDNLPAHSFFEMLGTSRRSDGDSSLVRVQTSTETKDGPPLPTSQLPEVTRDLKARFEQIEQRHAEALAAMEAAHAEALRRAVAEAKTASECRQLERVRASPIRTFVAATASQATPTSPPFGKNTEKSASSPAPKTPKFACSTLSQQYQATLTQLPTHTELDEQLDKQRVDLAIVAGLLAAQSKATRGPIMSKEQVTRLAQYVVIQRNLLQHMCRMLHAQHLDAAHYTGQASSLFATDEKHRRVINGRPIDGVP